MSCATSISFFQLKTKYMASQVAGSEAELLSDGEFEDARSDDELLDAAFDEVSHVLHAGQSSASSVAHSSSAIDGAVAAEAPDAATSKVDNALAASAAQDAASSGGAAATDARLAAVPPHAVEEVADSPTAGADEKQHANIEEVSPAPAGAAVEASEPAGAPLAGDAETQQQQLAADEGAGGGDGSAAELAPSEEDYVDDDAAVAEPAEADPGFTAPDGTWISRRRRSVSEADAVPDEKKDATLATACKETGNRLYANFKYEEALECYTEALKMVPRGAEHDASRAIYYCNRAACYAGLNRWGETLYDCDRALEYNPTYVKALARRAIALERLERLEEAQKDLEAWVAVEPRNPRGKGELERVTKAITERNEKLKDEMLGKLKDLGNTILGKFGLSLDNFKAEKDPNTGSYSISFQR